MKESFNFKLLGLNLMLLILVCLPRFNGNQILVQQEPYDAKYFNAYVEYFRGELPSAPIRPASNWRFLVPLIASALPFSPATSLNLINLILIMGSLLFFYLTLENIGVKENKRWQAISLFIFSFPTFYYSCISYVDPGSIFFLSLGIFLWFKQKYFLFIVSLIAGLMAKETIALIFPFVLAHALLNKNYKQILLLVGALILYWLEYKIIRDFAPLSLGETRDKFWSFNLNAAKVNLYRMHTWFSLILSFGLIGILFIYKLFLAKKNLAKTKTGMAALAGFAGVLGLYAYSYISTIADGRIIWHGYFFMLLLIFDPNIEKQKINGE
jgi:hypothetical protein